MTNIKELIAKIKEKKEFASIEDSFIEQEIEKCFNQDKKARLAVSEGRIRSEEYKKAVKAVRAVLRRIYGVFLTKESAKREEYLEQARFDKILETHLSTRERIILYPHLYQNIFAITGEPKVILDLGCGLNPASYPYMNIKAEYYAAEISKDDVDFLNKYFKKAGIKGKAAQLDLIKAVKNPQLLNQFPKADVCFLFKVLDEIEAKKGRKRSEELIKAINAKWVVISFATRIVTGKPMKCPERRWLEQMLTRLGYSFKIIKEVNEIFYVVKKS